MLAPLFPGWVTLEKDLHIPEPRFPDLPDGTSVKLFAGIEEIMSVKPLAQRTVESKSKGPKLKPN